MDAAPGRIHQTKPERLFLHITHRRAGPTFCSLPCLTDRRSRAPRAKLDARERRPTAPIVVLPGRLSLPALVLYRELRADGTSWTNGFPATFLPRKRSNLVSPPGNGLDRPDRLPSGLMLRESQLPPVLLRSHRVKG